MRAIGYRPEVTLQHRGVLAPRKKTRTYSKGNRQKVALVAALASTAELLVLDEPTAGLDPLMEAVFRDCVLQAKGEGRTVLLSSHILAEVEALCDRVTIIRQGRRVQTGSLDELRHLTRTHIVATVDCSPESLTGVPGVLDVGCGCGPGMFALKDPNETTALLGAGGFTQIEIEPISPTVLLGGGGHPR